MKCTYKVKIGKNDKVVFNSEQELDTYLSKKYESINWNKIDPTLQVDPIQETIDKVNSITSKISNISTESVVINEDGDMENIMKIPNSIGATRFITTYGNPDDLKTPLIPEFNLQQYLQNRRNNLLSQGISNNEIDSILKNEQQSWKQLTDYGTEVHALFESLINNNKVFTKKLLSDDQVDALTEEFEELIEMLKQKHGQKAQFFTEVPIISDTLNEAYQNAGITSINGRIDLMVIDEKGYANIYDFKVSRKPVGVWEDTRNNPGTWHSIKKLSAGYQLGMYKAILNQYGITVGEAAVIPIKIDPKYDENGLIEKLDEAHIKMDAIKNRPFNSDHWHNITYIIPVKTLLDGVDLMKAIQEPMSKFTPNYELETEVQRNEVTVDLYMNDGKTLITIDESSSNRVNGKYLVINPYRHNKKTYCETKEEARAAIAELVRDENKHRGDELFHLAETIQMAMEGYATLQDLASDNVYKSDYCQKIFRKYIESRQKYGDKGWQFQNNPDFIAAGIFVFTKGNLLEIVSIHHHATHVLTDLGRGKTLLGATHPDRDVDTHEILFSTNGNIDLIKVMTLLNSMPETLKNYKVNKIASFNIWMQQGTETYLETLYDNFAKLCKIHNIPLNIKRDNFSRILENVVNTIQDVCDDDLVKNIGEWTFTFSPDDIIQGVPFILEKMEQLRKLNQANDLRTALRTGTWNFDDPIQLAYMLLSRALNKLNGYDIYIEKDPEKWVGNVMKGDLFFGSWVNSPGTSSSLNIQSLSKIFSIAETHIRRRELQYNKRVASVVRALYKSKERNSLLGGEVRYFDNLFVKDENGNIDKSFRLKDPETSTDLSQEEKDFINLFLEIVNNFKYKGDQTLIENAKNSPDGEYYQVPLALGDFKTQLHNKGYAKAISTKFNESLNFLRILPQQETDFAEARKQQKVYNKFNISSVSRLNIIEQYGVEGLETQLENLLLDVIHTYTTEAVMKEYLPRLQGIKISLQYINSMYGVATDKIVEYIDKYLDLNVFGKPIMDEEVAVVYKGLSAVKAVTSATALGVNFRSGIREMLQGAWIHMSRTLVDAYGKDQFTKKDVAKAWGIVFKDSINNINLLTLTDAINVEYGMSNADPHLIQERLSQSRAGLLNFNSDTLYFFNRVPDAYHRLGLLIAKMLHDGCWEAHSMVNDELVYDFKKDKRFSLLNDPNANKNSEEYRKQRGLYMAMLEQFNREGWNLKNGDALPRAYTIQEGTSIKSFSELCFGHYDRSTQMMLKHTSMGALILQFRTFLSAKLEQWTLKPGTYNQGKFVEKFNEDGVRYVRIYTFDENGIPSVRIGLETEVREGDSWEPYIEWEGRFMEGIAYSMLSFGKALYKMDYKELHDLWKNDTKRANFFLFLLDMIIASLLMWIIKATWLNDEDEDLGFVDHLFGTALYTSLSDGPVHTILGSMFGDLNPPAWTTLKQVYNNTTGVITGDRNAWDAAVNTFGALRSFKYLED